MKCTWSTLLCRLSGWILWFGVGMVQVQVAAANVVYVKTVCAGLPSGSCFGSIQEGVRHAMDPDGATGGLRAQILVFPGMYMESVDLSRMGEAFVNGTTGDVLLLAVDNDGFPAPGAARIEAGDGSAIHTALPFTGNVTLDGFTLHSATNSGINLANPSEVRGAVIVRNSMIEGARKQGVEIRSQGAIEIYTSRVSGSYENGFDLFTRQSLVISRTVSTGNKEAGFEVFGPSTASITGAEASNNGRNGFDFREIGRLQIHSSSARSNEGDGLFLIVEIADIFDFEATDNVGNGVNLFCQACATICRSTSNRNHTGYIVTPSRDLKLSVNGSDARGNQTGFFFQDVDNPGDVTTLLEHNNITGNPALGIGSRGIAADISASHNWWGSVSGPMHPDNPAGEGDKIMDGAFRDFGPGLVRFAPWLVEPAGRPATCVTDCQLPIPPIIPTLIPTLETWGMVLLSLLLGALALFRLRFV